MPPATERLVAFLLDDPARDPPLADELATWLAGTPRFRAFTEAHRDKIRKKLRTAAEPDARRDVRAELAVARLLLSDRHIELVFEPARAVRGGPDFAVTYRRRPAFNLEVTRPHRSPSGAHPGPILPKLRQLPPGTPNLLLVVLDGTDATAATWDVAAAVRALRATADAKDEEYFTRRGYAGTRDFYDRFLRLGGVLTWAEAAENEARAAAWINRSARSPLPDRALRACLTALRT